MSAHGRRTSAEGISALYASTSGFSAPCIMITHCGHANVPLRKINFFFLCHQSQPCRSVQGKTTCIYDTVLLYIVQKTMVSTQVVRTCLSQSCSTLGTLGKSSRSLLNLYFHAIEVNECLQRLLKTLSCEVYITIFSHYRRHNTHTLTHTHTHRETQG